MERSRQAIGSVTRKMDRAAEMMHIRGRWRSAYFSEGRGYPGVFLLFFLPSEKPNFVATVRFDQSIQSMSIEQVSSVAQQCIQQMIGTV